eukprot:TRINITY_DN3814_c0_g2_i1.p1 TRINITY_DN3814_c0_g2~~TRINITY_DN3814_c0_g2_i1.p1  ORF type:complete len:360 (-),score=42.03 TRINITY_DN3814_c0_g2_i1:171-1196(-)
MAASVSFHTRGQRIFFCAKGFGDKVMQYYEESIDWRSAFKAEGITIDSYARGAYTSQELGKHTGMCLVANLNSDLIFLGGSEGLLKMYNRSDYQLRSAVTVDSGNVRAIGLCNNTAATGGSQRTVCVIDIPTGTELHRLSDHTREINDVSISETLLISSADDGQTLLYDARSYQQVGAVPKDSRPIYAHQHDDHILVTGTNSSIAHIYDRRMGLELLHTFSCGASDIWFDDTAIFLANTNFQAFDRTTFEHDPSLSFKLPGTCFSMDANRTIAAVSAKEHIYIIDRRGKTQRRQLTHGSQGVYGMAFEGRTMISGGFDSRCMFYCCDTVTLMMMMVTLTHL